MYQAKSGIKKFSLYWGGPLTKKIFSQSEHVSSQIWCQKTFPLLGGGHSTKKNFFQSQHVSSQIWCQKIFPLLGGSLNKKIFFPVWTCIKPNLVSKNFPFTGRGGSLNKKNFFSVWTCIKPNLVSKNFPFTRGESLAKNFFSSLNMYQAKSGVKIFSLYWDWDQNLVSSQGWISLPENLRPGTPPPPHLRLDQPTRKSETWDPPKCEQTETITFPHPLDGRR